MMKLQSILALCCLVAVSCDSDAEGDAPKEGGLGEVSLADTSDNSGKADALEGRRVTPYLTELLKYDDATKRGTTTVTSFEDDEMITEAPLLVLQPAEDALQVTVASGDETVDVRFLLAYRTSEAGPWALVVVQGEGEFEDGNEVDADDAQTTPLEISFFQSISILKSENTISVASDGAGGQTTSRLEFDLARAEFAVYAIPVDTGLGNPLVGSFDYAFDAQCDGRECGTEAPVDPEVPIDDYAQARDVDLEEVTIGGAAISYTAASVDNGFGLGGTEFWQKWSGGHNPTYSYSEGSEAGRKCMLASAIRFEAIMSDPPESIVTLRDESNWSGRFFNWNDDYSEAGSDDSSGSVLWAWRTGLIKWISQTGKDGTCYLPTRATVEAAAANCLATAGTDDGEIEGCQGRG